MEQELIRFRRAADRENRGRRAICRRYSPTLQRQAVNYCQSRQQHGQGLRSIAAALGIAPWTLYRWMRGSARRPRFRPIEVIPPEPSAVTPVLVVTVTTDGPRVEGLTVETAARLLTLLR